MNQNEPQTIKDLKSMAKPSEIDINSVVPLDALKLKSLSQDDLIKRINILEKRLALIDKDSDDYYLYTNKR